MDITASMRTDTFLPPHERPPRPNQDEYAGLSPGLCGVRLMAPPPCRYRPCLPAYIHNLHASPHAHPSMPRAVPQSIVGEIRQGRPSEARDHTLFIDSQDILHRTHTIGTSLRNHPRRDPPGFEFVFFSTCRALSRLMCSTYSNSTIRSASSCILHFA